MVSRSSIKKCKEYDFTADGITAEVIEKAKENTYDKPLYVRGKMCDFKLYWKDGKVQLYMLHSWNKFESIA